MYKKIFFIGLLSILFRTNTAEEPSAKWQLRQQQMELSLLVDDKITNLPANATDRQKFIFSSIREQLFAICEQIQLAKGEFASEDVNRLSSELEEIRAELREE